MTSWGVSKVKYKKLDEILLLDMEKEDIAFVGSSAASPEASAFINLSGSGMEPNSGGASDTVDGYGDFEAVGVSSKL